MAKPGQVFTMGDILRQLDEDFDIPDDAIDSEIELDDEVEEEEDLIADFADQGENIRLSEFEIVEIDDPEPARKRGRRSVPDNFEELQWSKNANAFPGYEFGIRSFRYGVLSLQVVLLQLDRQLDRFATCIHLTMKSLQ